MDAGNACGNVVSRERRGCGKERQGDEALAPHTSILMAGRCRSAASQQLCAAHWGPPPDERCAWDATVRKSPGTWRKGMRAASSENRDPRTRENRGRKRSPTVSKIRTNSDQSKLSHTSQFTVIECPFACPIPYIYVLHPASTTPRISPTMHYALRTHYSLTTVPPLPPLPTLPPLPPLPPLPHLHTASSKCVPQLEMAPHSYCLHASAIHALSIWWNC